MPTPHTPQSEKSFAALTLQRSQPKDGSGVCRDCGAALAVAEAFSENGCGAFCEMCFLLHIETCGNLALDLDEIYGPGSWSDPPVSSSTVDMPTIEEKRVVCEDCGFPLAAGESITQNVCGTFCEACFPLHSRCCWSCGSSPLEEAAPSHHAKQSADSTQAAAFVDVLSAAALRQSPVGIAESPSRKAKQLSLF